jgi:hypothetical protein
MNEVRPGAGHRKPLIIQIFSRWRGIGNGS